MKLFRYMFLFILMASSLFAQTADEAVQLMQGEEGFGIRAAGMGNAYTGVADDYSAIYWNPAGLAQIKNNEILMSLYNLRYANEATYLNETTNGTRTFTKFQSFGYAYPFPVARGSLVMAFGYQRINGMDSFSRFSGYLPGTSSNYLAFNISNDLGDYGTLDFDRDIRQEQTTSSEGNLANWSFGMAIDVSPAFSAGFALNFVTGSSDYASRYAQTDPNQKNVYDIYDGNNQHIETFMYDHYNVNQDLHTSYSAFQAKLGGLFRLGEHLRFGANITLPMTLNVEELWSVDDDLGYDIDVLRDNTIYQFVEAGNVDAGTFEYHISTPFTFSGGLSFRNSFLVLSTSAEYTDWSQLRYEAPDNADASLYSNLLAENTVLADQYQPVLSYGVGAEVNLFGDALSLRSGFRYLPSALKDASADADKKFYSAGAAFRLDKSSILEVAYTRHNEKQTLYYNYDWDADPMQTSESSTAQKVLVGLKLIF